MPAVPAPRITDNADHLRAVQEGMLATVNGPRGTARAVGVGAPYLIAGKTGTAQRSSRRGNISSDPHSLPYHLRHTALFVGYAPADDPKIAIAVVVEHGGYGGSAAAPIARKVFDAWLLGKMPEPDPAATAGRPAVEDSGTGNEADADADQPADAGADADAGAIQ